MDQRQSQPTLPPGAKTDARGETDSCCLQQGGTETLGIQPPLLGHRRQLQPEIEGHRRLAHAPASGRQCPHHAIAPLPIHLTQLLGPMGRLLQSSNGPGLKGKGLVEIDHGFQLAQAGDQGRSPDSESQAIAAKTPTLGEGKKFNALAPPIRMEQKGRRLPLQGEVDIGIVVGQHDVMVDGTSHGAIQPALIAGGGRGVVGKPQHHQFQLVPDAGWQLVEIGAPPLIGAQGQQGGAH